ncbi:hypothetical protein GUJ93_ZPchr0006g46375 [Zizania palustris]|uniref:MADS-box domain-containing protein n=2 Tax=Zizania palustris TaxID=103762 RepID=A0A8J5SZ77_ZIZPA|nr:hypothetical protein GUJ93_ZPchr0006g46375 [Zizania palustris]
MGRGKIEMKPITDKKARYVCFSKRRSVIFNKANELSMLCAVDVAVCVFSPAGKPYFFGNPSPGAVARRLLAHLGASNDVATANVIPTSGGGGRGSGNRDVNEVLQEIQIKEEELRQEMESEERRARQLKEVIDKERKEHKCMEWMSISVKRLGLDELEEFNCNLDLVGALVANRRCAERAAQVVPVAEMNMSAMAQPANMKMEIAQPIEMDMEMAQPVEMNMEMLQPTEIKMEMVKPAEIKMETNRDEHGNNGATTYEHVNGAIIDEHDSGINQLTTAN